MTAQNLEVYETFQAPGASFVRHCKIRHLTIASNGRHERPKVDQYVPYRIDAPSKKPLVHDLGPAVSSVFLSVGRMRQAQNMIEALAFAREIGTPLNAHATIHWVGTDAGDDPDGRRFAKVREGFDKWLKRHGIPGGLTAIWVRERLSGGTAEVVHCHMLFHLAHPFLRGGKRLQVVRALERLIDRHGEGDYADYTLKLTFPRNPNGIYLVKGGGPEVWRRFGVPRSWRGGPRISIFGKRSGTTQSIGPAARQQRHARQQD